MLHWREGLGALISDSQVATFSVIEHLVLTDCNTVYVLATTKAQTLLNLDTLSAFLCTFWRRGKVASLSVF